MKMGDIVRVGWDDLYFYGVFVGYDVHGQAKVHDSISIRIYSSTIVKLVCDGQDLIWRDKLRYVLTLNKLM